jgi:predicted anti-sigma-YlaC factor YlaD
MDCEQVREALSALIDGEASPVAPERLEAHLAGCTGCAGWRERAQEVTRAARVRPVRVPDLTAPVLAAVAADPQGRYAVEQRLEQRRRSRRTVLRIAVAAAAVAQFALALPVLIGADLHISREIAVFELALAVGFAFAAWRPQLARALVPVAVVLAGGLALTSLVDVVSSSLSLWHETGHLAAAVQAALLWALARNELQGTRRHWRSVAISPA